MEKQPPRKRKDVEQRREKIMEAIRELEASQPLQEWGATKLQTFLKKQGTNIPYRRLLPHLKGLVLYGLIKETNKKAKYLSTEVVVWKHIIQSSLSRDYYSASPKLEGEQYETFLSNRLQNSNEIKQILQKKNPLYKLTHKNEMDTVEENLKLTRLGVDEQLKQDLAYLENASEILMFGAKKISDNTKYLIQGQLNELLYKMLQHERTVAEASNKPFSEENFKFTLMVSVNLEKIEKSPTYLTTIELIEKAKLDEETKRHIKKIVRLVNQYTINTEK